MLEHALVLVDHRLQNPCAPWDHFKQACYALTAHLSRLVFRMLQEAVKAGCKMLFLPEVFSFIGANQFEVHKDGL